MASTTAESNDDEDYDYDYVEEVNCPEHLIESAHAKLNYEDIEGALADVNQAIKLDPSIAKAYLLKGAIHYMIKEYDEAKETLEIGISIAPEQYRSFFKSWIEKCNIEEKKDASLNPPVEKAPENDGPVEQDNASRASERRPMMKSTSAKPKFRHEHYEKLEEVVIDIFAKSVPAESVSVQFSEEILVVRIEIPGEDPFNLNLRLFGKIIPSKSRYSILKTKLEIRLAKAEALYWKSLTSPEEKSVEQMMNTSSAHSSYKPRNFWDKLEAELMEEVEKTDIMLGKAGVRKALQGIYGDLTEDGRKAMRKSFVESNGTVLSTSWEAVSEEKVELSNANRFEGKGDATRLIL
ncbi:SGT1 homolog A-like protein [Drosera capensis]